MLSILLVTLILLVVTYTIGKLVSEVSGYFQFLNFSDIVFTGLALVNTMLTIFSIYKPSGMWPAIILFAFSIVVWIVILSKQKLIIQNKTQLGLVLMIPFALILSIIAADGPLNGDSISYHIPAIKWIEAYPVIPGLGNLHARYAFNPNIFNLMAGFTFTEITGQAIYAVNTFFSLVFFYYLVSLFKQRHSMKAGLQLFFMVTGILSVQFMMLRLSSPTPDLIAGLLPVYMFLRYVEFNFLKKDPDSQQTWSLIWLLMVLSVYVVTVKLSAIFIILLPVIMIWQHRDALNIKNASLVIFPGILIMIPWIYRNFILSGYLVYPVNELDIFNVDWKIPEWIVIREKAIIHNWARWPVSGSDKVEGMSVSEWLPFWFSHLQFFWKVFIPITLLSSIMVPGLVIRYRKIKASWIIFRIWIVGFAGVIFWFITAPDPRFGYPFIIISALSILLFMDMVPSRWKTKADWLASVVGLLFIVICFALPLKSAFRLQKSMPKIIFNALPDDTYADDTLKSRVLEYSVEHIVLDPETYPKSNAIVWALNDAGKQDDFSLMFRGKSITDGLRIVPNVK